MTVDRTLEIVPFAGHHQADVRALVLAGLAERWGELDPGLNRDLDDIAASYANGRVLVATSGGALVATGAIVPRGDGTAEIVRMSVVPARRGDGIGRELVEALLDVARSWDVGTVICETSSSWTDAVEFYCRCGFRITHHEDGPTGGDTWFALDLD